MEVLVSIGMVLETRSWSWILPLQCGLSYN